VDRRRRVGKLGWRWRRNPLRRRTDVVEAWLGLLTALMFFCLVPLVGWWAGHSVDRALQRVVRTQRAERTLVPAQVAPVVPAAHGAAAADTDPRHKQRLRWTAPDHSVHTDSVPVDLEVWQGGKILLWTDHKGALVPPPLDTTTASTHSVLAGTAAATSAGGLLLISRQVLLWRLMRRRLDSWEREWARVGQDWGRTGAGG
jgi:hypothetical protein